jgi:hypothetical protein
MKQIHYGCDVHNAQDGSKETREASDHRRLESTYAEELKETVGKYTCSSSRRRVQEVSHDVERMNTVINLPGA